MPAWLSHRPPLRAANWATEVGVRHMWLLLLLLLLVAQAHIRACLLVPAMPIAMQVDWQ